MTSRALILGLAGTTLSAEDRAALQAADPWGLILFARNIETPDQVAALVAEARAVLGRSAPVFVDQEGGRVARFRPPHWRAAPAGGIFAALYREDPERAVTACWLNYQLIARELSAMGVNAVCAPVLDRPVDGADPIIGDRALGADADAITALGRATLEGLARGGAAGVIKHIPGHGRAQADSHLTLPVVDASGAELAATDFEPFRRLNQAPMAMTAHVTYVALDPTAPATVSDRVIAEVIRGAIGFDGLLMSDDLAMAALDGALVDRARAALQAGCDVVLHCPGRTEDARALADITPRLAGASLERADRAFAEVERTPDWDAVAAEAELAQILGGGVSA
ncbi:MAG: beta-N-acetylhexosaminidase [Maricaulaceae bacterium]